MTTSIFLCGVGGQGILKLNNLISEAAVLDGYEVIGNEVHGMAQRGGSVVCHLRFNRGTVNSPLIPMGEADFIVSLEKIEPLRYHHFLKPGGKVIVNDFSIIPTTVSVGSAVYPDEVKDKLDGVFDDCMLVSATDIAKEVGNPRAANTVLAGILAKSLPFSKEIWYQAINNLFPEKIAKLNIEAFEKGLQL